MLRRPNSKNAATIGRPGEFPAAHFFGDKVTVGRLLLAAVFVVAGMLHFVLTPVYMRIMPGYLPSPRMLVLLSGVFEILGGVGLVLPGFPPVRQIAACGLISLLIAVSPANVQMALDHARWPGIPEWLLWVRVPLQLPLIWWASLYARGS